MGEAVALIPVGSGNIPGAGTCIPSWKARGRWWFDGYDAQFFALPCALEASLVDFC